VISISYVVDQTCIPWGIADRPTEGIADWASASSECQSDPCKRGNADRALGYRGNADRPLDVREVPIGPLDIGGTPMV
jgi:hypothetical protein